MKTYADLDDAIAALMDAREAVDDAERSLANGGSAETVRGKQEWLHDRKEALRRLLAEDLPS